MLGRITPIVKNLLIINILIWGLQSFLNLPFVEWFGLKYIFADSRPTYQFITYMFVHSDATFWHLFGNMFALFIFGPLLEQFMGSNRFLAFYMICGVGAGILYSGVNFYETYQLQRAYESFQESPSPNKFLHFVQEHRMNRLTQEGYNFVHKVYPADPDNPQHIAQAEALIRNAYVERKEIPMVGASGAIFGVLMAFALLFPNLELMLLFPPIPIKAKYFVLIYGGFEVYSLLNQSPDDNVAHLAHIGGMLIGFLLIRWWNIKGPYQ